MAETRQKSLVVLTGPTASGKTSLAIKLAEQFGGEIICADSRTIYRGMDIGTAKPTTEERDRVPHWGLDLVDPGERFTVADFKQYAVKKIKEIRSRDKVPFLVGGTGLYIDSVIFDYSFAGGYDEGRRREMEEWSIEKLHDYCYKNNIKLPENSNNKRYVIREIERKSISVKSKNEPIKNTYVVSITTNKNALRTRIESRIEQIFKDNVVKEATLLSEKYGWDNEAMTGNVYALVSQYKSGDMNYQEMLEKAAVNDWGLAKRQMTWLRRNPFIAWGTLESAEHYLADKLANR